MVFASVFLVPPPRGAGSEALPVGAITTVMWLVRLLIRAARPCARGRNRFIVGPSST